MLTLVVSLSMVSPLVRGDDVAAKVGPGSVEALVKCRAIDKADERLACYDREVGDLEEKVASKKLAIVVPRPGGMVGNGSNNENEFDVLNTMANKLSRTSDGSVTFELPNGTVWIQTDQVAVFGLNPGVPVSIRKASFGSYFAKLGKNIPIRVKRIR